MEPTSLWTLVGTAAVLGVVHTLTGPDHYIPFVAMSRIGRWSLVKTIVVTLACGVGHVASSIVLGAVGIGFGLALGKLEWLEGFRGNIAGWLLLGFGLAYLAWGIKRAIRHKPHAHLHQHANGTVHTHDHTHELGHAHTHAGSEPGQSMTPWILFTIFVFGPCEPLIPVLMFPAATLSLWGVVLVAAVFGVCTLATMTTAVVAGTLGLSTVSFAWLGRYAHAIAGFAVAACGAAIQLGF